MGPSDNDIDQLKSNFIIFEYAFVCGLDIKQFEDAVFIMLLIGQVTKEWWIHRFLQGLHSTCSVDMRFHYWLKRSVISALLAVWSAKLSFKL